MNAWHHEYNPRLDTATVEMGETPKVHNGHIMQWNGRTRRGETHGLTRRGETHGLTRRGEHKRMDTRRGNAWTWTWG